VEERYRIRCRRRVRWVGGVHAAGVKPRGSTSGQALRKQDALTYTPGRMQRAVVEAVGETCAGWKPGIEYHGRNDYG